MGWEEERPRVGKCTQRQAQAWIDSLDIFQINPEDWNKVKTSFLQSFKPKQSPSTVCANLQELIQKPRESAFNYFAWNIGMFKRIMTCKTDQMPHTEQWHQHGSLDQSQESPRVLFPDPAIHCWTEWWPPAWSNDEEAFRFSSLLLSCPWYGAHHEGWLVPSSPDQKPQGCLLGQVLKQRSTSTFTLATKDWVFTCQSEEGV